MKFPDLTQCTGVTVDERNTLTFYLGTQTGEWVQLTKDGRIRYYNCRKSDFYEELKPATRKQKAQFVAACLVHDIEVELPF